MFCMDETAVHFGDPHILVGLETGIDCIACSTFCALPKSKPDSQFNLVALKPCFFTSSDRVDVGLQQISHTCSGSEASLRSRSARVASKTAQCSWELERSFDLSSDPSLH